jgi:putative membrane protein
VSSDRQGSGSDPSVGGESSADGWKRVHIISPLVRGWIALLAALYVLGRDSFEALLTGNGTPSMPGGAANSLWALGVLAAVVLAFGVGFFLSWFFTRYRVTGHHVSVTSGVLYRRSRQARLDRVQAVDIIQPFLARVFGLAELRFEVADAGESAVRLAFLKLAEAQQLRATILARAAGLEGAGAGEPLPEAPEYPILALRPSRVIGAAALSGTTVVLAAGIGAAATVAARTGGPAPLVVAIPLLLGVASSYWNLFSTAYNFRAAVSPDGLRVRYGLLDTRAQTVPPGRVQAVGVVQPPLWRLKGWYRLTVNVAGYGAGEAQMRATLLPAGTRAEVMQLLALVLPDPGTERPLEVFGAGMDGRDHDGGFVATPRRARWIAPLAWRRNGFAVTGTALLARSGVLWRCLAVVPHERTQSLALHQGPVGRALRVVDLALHTTPGPVSPRIRAVDGDTAWRLFHDQAARAAAARRHSAPEQWLRPDPPGCAAAQPGQDRPTQQTSAETPKGLN